jgi:acetyl-CoA synthetase
MNEHLYPVPENFAAAAHIKLRDYQDMYAESVRDPAGFWGRIGRRVDWIKEYTQVKDTSFAESDFHIRWFYDGILNVSSNCLDRHLATRGEKTAIIWEGDDPAESQRLSYRELHERVCQ